MLQGLAFSMCSQKPVWIHWDKRSRFWGQFIGFQNPIFISENRGPLLSCDDMTCRYGAVCNIRNGIATCNCHMTCHGDASPISVCGTDGQTYSSHCQLNLFSCRLQREIQVAYEGSCSGNTPVDTTASTPVRSRKTTRHVHDDAPSEDRVTPDVRPTDSSSSKYGKSKNSFKTFPCQHT